MLIAKKAKLVTIAFPREYLDEITLALITSGLIEPTMIDDNSKVKIEIRELLKDITQSRRRLEEISSLMKLHLNKEIEAIKFTTKNWITNAREALYEFEEIKKIIEPKLEEIAQLQKALEEYEKIVASIKLIRNVDLDLTKRSNYIEYIVTIINTEKLSELIESIHKEYVLFEIIDKEDNLAGVLMIYPKSIKTDIEKILSKHDIKSISLPENLPQNPSKAYEYSISMINLINEKIKIDLSFYHPQIQSVYSKLCAVEVALTLLATSKTTNSFVVLRGYVDPERVDEMKNLMVNITRGVFTLTIEDGKDTPIIPTIVSIPRLLKPFHKLVLQYGAPVPNEIVPTVFFAITFPLIFALMFPDAGHAFIISLFGVYYYYKKKSDYGLLFIYLGIAAFITGFLAGEFFGPLLKFKDLVWNGHPILESPVEAHSPSKALLKLINLSLSIGAFILIAGVLLSIINSFISRDYEKIILLKMPKLILFGVPLSGFIIFGVEQTLSSIYDAAIGGAVTLYGKVIRYSFVASVVAIIFLEPLYGFINKDHKKDFKFGMSLVNSFMEIFESILLLIGNTASFLRILGLALAHSGIMYGFAAMAQRAFEGGIPGIFLGAIAYIFGNILGIALEGIVAYAHCTRLHFYEWFTKFYSGRGKLFTPLSIQSKIIFQTQY